jgi:hypothetical protein
VSDGFVRILDGNTFVVSDDQGDIEASPTDPTGLFTFDTRFLSLGDHLVVDPALPAVIGHLELLDIPGRWGRIDAFGRGRVEVDSRRRVGARVAQTAARKR